MKVLRVYWIDHKYAGLRENHKTCNGDHHYHTIERSTDFHPDTEFVDAKAHILNIHGNRPSGDGIVEEFAEVISWKIADTHPFACPIDLEDRYQGTLFDVAGLETRLE